MFLVSILIANLLLILGACGALGGLLTLLKLTHAVRYSEELGVSEALEQ